MLKDYDGEIRRVESDIERLRFPGVELRLDEKYYNCFKNDTNKIIVVRDEMMGRFRSENDYGTKSERPPKQYKSPTFDEPPPPKYEEINPHSNRDQIKRTTPHRT